MDSPDLQWLPHASTYLLPALLVLVGFTLEQWWQAFTNVPAREESAWGVIARWAWRAGIFVWVVGITDPSTAPIRLVPPFSPARLVNELLVTVTFIAGTWAAWAIARPSFVGSSQDMSIPTSPALWGLIVAIGEGTSRQLAYGVLRLPAGGEPVGVWGMTFLALVLGVTPILITGIMHRGALLTAISLIGGAGLGLTTDALWAPVVWDVIALGTLSVWPLQDNEIPEHDVG